VPTLNVSLLDFTFKPKKSANLESLRSIFEDYAQGLENVFEMNEQPLVSIDFN